ncbi:hypothetical protein ELD03_05795 [Staphylococcus pseudintermedius]|nr:hypothetical protein [Staphylococcus pseudintermedius]
MLNVKNLFGDTQERTREKKNWKSLLALLTTVISRVQVWTLLIQMIVYYLMKLIQLRRFIMSGKDHNMPKSQQTLLAIITFVFLLEIILTAFFKGLTIIHGILIVVFLTRQIKRKGF